MGREVCGEFAVPPNSAIVTNAENLQTGPSMLLLNRAGFPDYFGEPFSNLPFFLST